MIGRIQIAQSIDFLGAFAALPKTPQKKVGEFLAKFMANPTSPGINYERLNGTNPDYRSVRIDRNYRCILLAPRKGNTYVLLWVDKHDDAYDWASRKQTGVNPTTGVLQIWETETVDAPPQSASALDRQPPDNEHGTHPEPTNRVLDDRRSQPPTFVVALPDPDMPNGPPFALDEGQLRSIGVPEALLPAVLALADEAGLDVLRTRLPTEAHEALSLYGAGLDWAEVLADYATPPDLPVDVDDIDAALERAASRRRFHVIDSDDELEAMLAAPLERWRVFLHPSQRKLIERNWNGPVRVTGGAGTGKTVVAMHRAAWLARRLADDAGSASTPILFLTYNTNLAADIRAQLATLVSASVASRIEVVNVDAWVRRFLTTTDHAADIRYDNDLDTLLAEVLKHTALELERPLPASFFREEWDRVVQPIRVKSSEDYLYASRTGRGVALTRRQRAAIWPIFGAVRDELTRRGWQTWSDAMLEASDRLTADGAAPRYRHVIVDETQDMGPEALQLIRALAPEGANDLFFVGDGHQRIYRRRAIMGRCGIRIVGRSRKLRINYRTTEEIRRFASAVLSGHPIDDLDGGMDSGTDYLSLTRGPVPEFVQAADEAAEFEALSERLLAVLDAGGRLEDCCVVLRTIARVGKCDEALRSAGFDTVVLARNADDASVPGVRIATMHRVKGLEFRHVFMAAMCSGVVPNRFAVDGSEDRTELVDRELAERSLVHVTASRAIESLTVSWHGDASEYLAEL